MLTQPNHSLHTPRYKMPRLLAKIEGRGNGVKTVVINMKDVADALHRGPAEVTKFFGTGAFFGFCGWEADAVCGAVRIGG